MAGEELYQIYGGLTVPFLKELQKTACLSITFSAAVSFTPSNMKA